MKPWLLAAIIVFFAVVYAEDQYLDYDATAIKRFEEELKKLGVTPPAVTQPENPVQRPLPTVKAPAGDFQGYWTKSQFGRPIAAFEGIPYAKPPVGPLTFTLSEAIPRLPNPFNANKVGSRCVQWINGGSVGQEDCLFINVYSPLISSWPENKTLPVVVSVHGGAFVAGEGSAVPPHMLLEKDVLLVTFNYRLDAFGFLATGDGVIPGNLGLKDQVLALRWTQQNIESFGGDRNKVTIFGISAGAASVDFLKLSPLTKGLIHRAIVMSGSSFCPWALAAPGEMRVNVGKAAEILKCTVQPSDKFLECLRAKPAAEISSLLSKMKPWWQNLEVLFKVVVEGDVPGAFLPEHPSKLFAKNYNDIPLLTGVCSEEGSAFGMLELFNIPFDLRILDQEFLIQAPKIGHLYEPSMNSTKTLETLRRAYFGPGPLKPMQALLATKLFGDINFLWPAIKTVLSHARGSKSNAYFYHFDYKESRGLTSPAGMITRDFGVVHSGDAAYLYPILGSTYPQNVKMALIYTDLFMNFAINGVPSTNQAEISWIPVPPTEKDMPFLNVYSPSTIQLKKNLFAERWTLLKTLFESPPSN